MSNLIKISEDEKFKCDKNITEFLNPDYIYVPFSEDYKLNIKNHEEVYKEGILLSNDHEYIYSSVSGIVMGVCKMIVDGQIKQVIVIENNFEEKTKKVKGAKKNINDYSRESLINLINGFNAYSGNLEGNTMIISGIDIEPYESTMSYLISEYGDQILEAIDALYQILDVHKCFFAIKNNDSDNVKKLVNYIGTYPNIDLKLMPDLYPLGNKTVLIKELVLPKKINSGIIYLTVEDVFAIYNVLKRNKPITDKLVTFSGDLLSESKVMKVKIGTSIKDIIVNYFKITDKNFNIIINGLLSGYEIENLDAIITPNIHSVFINSAPKSTEDKCINCGMCVSKCPVGANPRNGSNMDQCIKCGICSYVCPAKRKFKGTNNE